MDWGKLYDYLKAKGFEGSGETISNGVVEICVDTFPFFVTKHKADPNLVGRDVYTKGFIDHEILKYKLRIVVSDPPPPSQVRGGDPDKSLEEKINRKWWQL
jgi:hypothetical protein